ncbi:MAG: zinc ABC transporter substrate-binding protein [Nitrospirae bacterium]|nr:zinc ABC transporter substrate-binding protein [Nitrospirota bacterium]
MILSACQQEKKFENGKMQEGLKHDDKKIRVITTIAPLYSFTKNVAGDYADVENLLPSGAGPHEYSLSPEDVIKISKAQVLIENGVGLEKWLDKLVAQGDVHNESAGVGKQIVADSSSGINIISNDPHIWLSPRNAVIQVKNIRDALIKADPANAGYYTKNAEAYIKRLERLDRGIMEITGSLKRKEFVSLHSAFLYFARDYGLRQAAVIQEFPETEPTPRHITDVMNAIRTNNIRVIFSEPGVPQKVVETLAKDLNLQVYNLDTLETGAFYPEWYEAMMRANLEVLKMAMSQ